MVNFITWVSRDVKDPHSTHANTKHLPKEPLYIVSQKDTDPE